MAGNSTALFRIVAYGSYISCSEERQNNFIDLDSCQETGLKFGEITLKTILKSLIYMHEKPLREAETHELPGKCFPCSEETL